MVPPTGVPWKNQPIMSYSWLGFIAQTKIQMFNVSVPDSYIPVCHSSIKDLGPTSQKDIFDFTTLKGDDHLTTSWCCMNNSKNPTFMGPNVLRASACNGSLVSYLTKSSNLTGKNSYCILTTGHHKCILTKYITGLRKLYNSIFPPAVPPSFTSNLNVPNYLFPGDTTQAQANNTQGILCLEEGYLFVRKSWKKNQVWGLPHQHPNHTLGNWAIAQLISNSKHTSFWNNTNTTN
jgi:hypothetical protein